MEEIIFASGSVPVAVAARVYGKRCYSKGVKGAWTK